MGKTLIITEKQMNELKEILSEGISPVVYHFTSLQALYRILMTQKFYLKTGVFRDSYEHKLSDGKRMYYLSTTRNKNANEGYSNGYKSEGSVRITLDGEKLSHNYKGTPTNYWGDDSALGRLKYLNPNKVGQPLKWNKDMQQHKDDETEDRIWSFHPTIPNVMDYIKRVDILLPNENVISDYENRIVKAQQDGKDALVKSFQNSIENRKEEERHLKSIVYEIYNLIDRRGILFLYDNENDFIMGNNHTVKPEWLSNNDFYKDYKERQSVYSQQFNYKTNNALFKMLTSALAIMVYNERHENRKKRIIEYCKHYGFQNMLNQNLFTKVDSILYRNSNIFDISRDIDDNLFTNDEDASRVKDMVTHWMRKNGYRNLRNVVGEGKEITKVRQGMIAYESNEPDYEIGFEKGDLCPYAHVVTESQADSLKKYILLEDKRTKQAMNRTRQVIREHFNNEPWLDDVFNHQDNPKGLTYLEYMLEQFINEFYHNPQMRAGQTMRLMPLFCKLAFEFNFQNNNPDIAKLNRLRNILNHLFVLSQKGEDLSKISLDMSFDELNNRYGTVIDVEAQAEKERMANAEYTENEEYTVIGPVDFETAQKYGNESCPNSKLCYTQAKQTWDNYTSNGLNNAYIILKDGWENIAPQHVGGDNSPYDDYGLSMIFVFVDGEGDLVYCNTRWNHRAEYLSPFSCDHAMSKEMISELIGRRFELVFKPNTVWGDKIAQIQERLNNGEDPRDLFDDVDDFYEGFAEVILGYKSNFINTEGQIISDKWFDWVDDFHDGFARVKLDNKFNFINTEGQIISDKWFDRVDIFYDGFARVILGYKSNFINTEGQIMFNQWFDFAETSFYFNKLTSRTNENRKNKTLIITEEQAKQLQRYLMEETNPEDIDLSSFEIQDKLNPKFWKNNKLDSRIRLKLLDIADDFVDSLNIKWVDPEDITMTGSLANYTWNEEHSDIDLHIIMDYKKVDDKTDFVKNYFDAKKKEWNDKHSEIKIFGFPIEVYVQDKNEPHKSSGVYSLEKNEWIIEPNRKNFSENDYDDNTVKKTVSDYMNQIDDIEKKFNKVEDLHQNEDIYDETEEVFDNIKDERKNAFKKTNKELSTGNVIFKTLRRNGYIEKISNLKNKLYNKINSLS